MRVCVDAGKGNCDVLLNVIKIGRDRVLRAHRFQRSYENGSAGGNGNIQNGLTKCERNTVIRIEVQSEETLCAYTQVYKRVYIKIRVYVYVCVCVHTSYSRFVRLYDLIRILKIRVRLYVFM